MAVIYLDYHATTPLDPRVSMAMAEAQRTAFANPNSPHAAGADARRRVEVARRQVAELVGAEADDVRFTTGSSEALRLALAFSRDRSGKKRLRIVSSRIEHPALLSAFEDLDQVVDLRWLDPDASGRIGVDSIQRVLKAETDLLCLMAVNNEVGTVQPVREAAETASAAGVPLLVDATQAAGRMALESSTWGVDFLVMSAHKFYGPKGAGALVGPGLARMRPPATAPSHDSTPNVAAIVGMGEAARLRKVEWEADERRICGLRDWLEAVLLEGIPGAVINGDPAHRVAGNLHISTPAFNELVVAELYDTVAISTGAACVSGVDQPSHVLQAMKLPTWRQDGALRISLGKFTTREEIEHAAAAILAAVRKARMPLQTER